jgi:hypothetical protein
MKRLLLIFSIVSVLFVQTQAQETKSVPDTGSAPAPNTISDQNNALLPFAIEVEKLNAKLPPKELTPEDSLRIAKDRADRQAENVRLAKELQLKQNESLSKLREKPMTIADFRYFASTTNSLGKFHTAIGTISLLASAGSIITIVASASKYESWETYHTISIISSGVMLFTATWEIGIGVRLKNTARTFLF